MLSTVPCPLPMKPSLNFLSISAVLCISFGLLHADEPKPAASTPTPQAKWNVRVEVFMVALPEEKALALLPDLRDDAKIEAACTQLLDAVKRKEARLTGYPVVYSNDGQRARSATSAEKIYPTQYDDSASPTNFEKRNMGPELDVECRASANGEWIQLTVEIQRTELLQFEPYEVAPKEGRLPKVDQPLFFCAKDTQQLALHNGQRVLIGVHKLVKQEGDMELFILQATATAAH